MTPSKANLSVGHGGTVRHPGGGWYEEVATTAFFASNRP